MLSTDLFDYELPEELIAQEPSQKRGESKMLVIEPESGDFEIHPFSDITKFLTPQDIMVCNNTKVLRGRMFGIKNGDASGAKFELLLVAQLSSQRWSALLRPGKRAKAGTFVVLTDGDGFMNSNGDGFTVLSRLDDDTFEIEFNNCDAQRLQDVYGHIPLPPYIKRADTPEDALRYQTLFAKDPGAVAAPTAGLHFSEEILSTLKNRGIKRYELTLHVGPGTFKTVNVANVEAHKMHFEEYFLPEATADAINAAKLAQHNILAVGTTTVRTLESCVNAEGRLIPGHNKTDIFLYPPYQIKSSNMLLTNFHLPKSTLLMLVSCYLDREKMFAAYEYAKAKKMHFYSYGDCMLILPGAKKPWR